MERTDRKSELLVRDIIDIDPPMKILRLQKTKRKIKLDKKSKNKESKDRKTKKVRKKKEEDNNNEDDEFMSP